MTSPSSPTATGSANVERYLNRNCSKNPKFMGSYEKAIPADVAQARMGEFANSGIQEQTHVLWKNSLPVFLVRRFVAERGTAVIEYPDGTNLIDADIPPEELTVATHFAVSELEKRRGSRV